MKFNKEQREGVARSLDTLATSCLIGATIGVTGHSEITWFELSLLFFATPLLYSFSFLVRGLK